MGKYLLPYLDTKPKEYINFLSNTLAWSNFGKLIFWFAIILFLQNLRSNQSDWISRLRTPRAAAELQTSLRPHNVPRWASSSDVLILYSSAPRWQGIKTTKTRGLEARPREVRMVPEPCIVFVPLPHCSLGPPSDTQACLVDTTIFFQKRWIYA